MYDIKIPLNTGENVIIPLSTLKIVQDIATINEKIENLKRAIKEIKNNRIDEVTFSYNTWSNSDNNSNVTGYKDTLSTINIYNVIENLGTNPNINFVDFSVDLLKKEIDNLKELRKLYIKNLNKSQEKAIVVT